MRQRLQRDFFARNTLIVARALLGKFLVRKIGKKVIAVMITETEAYHGPNDLASHASRGRTPRTKVMFGPPGHAYIYLIYGMYHCLNIVTEAAGYPAAVLIRAAGSAGGPGKLCCLLQIDKSLNRADLTTSRKLWVEDRGTKNLASNFSIGATPRIGVDYAGKYKNKPWRFVLTESRL